MKKIVLISTLIATCAGLSAFGQGYFNFNTSKSQVWDGFTAGAAQRATTVNVAFLWAASGSVAKVSEFGAAVGTTTTLATSTYQVASAWADILTDANYTLAVNAANNQVAVATSASNGQVAYNGAVSFGVNGTTADVTYSLFMIGFANGGNAALTPANAALANAYVGWGSPVAYKCTLQTETFTSMLGLEPQFGVAGLIPEPSTMALAGLGALSLLAFRRRK